MGSASLDAVADDGDTGDAGATRGGGPEGAGDPGSLGSFLRSRRERVGPAEVGLPGGGRRRTPGLRREELAMLAGISVDYLVRLEQGRDRCPSAAVLAALADVLRLDRDERAHLTLLTARTSHAELCPAERAVQPLSAATRAVVDQLHPLPAFVLSPVADVLAWNGAFDALMRPTGLLDLVPPNLVRFTFLVPGARSTFPDWEAVAAEQVANLRAASGRAPGACMALVGELSVRSAEFARRWARHDVGEKRRGVKRLGHPVAGEVTVEFEALVVPGPGEPRLVIYRPVDEPGAARLAALVAASTRPAGAPHLRAVPGAG